MKAVVYSFTRRGAMLSINIGEALQKFDFEVRCLTMPKFAEEKIFLEAVLILILNCGWEPEHLSVVRRQL